MERSCRWLAVVATLLVALGGCRSSGLPQGSAELPSSLVGQELEYRFEIGRLYRASYSSETVEFRLLEPAEGDPPHATLPYSSRALRPGVFLVAWGGPPQFRATLVIDLARRELHASSARADGTLFFDTARIERISSRRPSCSASGAIPSLAKPTTRAALRRSDC